MEETKFCSHCGETIAKAAVICPKCGCQVEATQQAAPQIVINNSNQNQNQNQVNAAPVFAGGAKNKWVSIFLLLCCFELGSHAHKQLDYEEHAECNDEEVDYVLEKLTVTNSNLGNANGNAVFCDNCFGENVFQISKRGGVEKLTDCRHDDISNERGNDLTERTAHDNADCHIEDVTSCDERFEFGNKSVFLCHDKTPFLLKNIKI